MHGRVLLVRAAAFLLGLLHGFFFVFGPLFTDGPASLVAGERLVSLGVSFVAYLLVGLVAGLAVPEDRRVWAFLAAPGIALGLLYGLSERNVLVLAVLYGLLAAAGSWSGCLLGSRFRRRPAPEGPDPSEP